MNIRGIIIESFYETLEQTDRKLEVESLKDETILLQSGLDSLGFAILVASLEEKLGYDPFSMNDDPFYPQTFGEFVSFYEKMQPKT